MSNKNEQNAAEQDLGRLLQVRRDKLAELVEAGEDPFSLHPLT